MAQKLTASLPQDLVLPPKFTIRLTAVDAATGNLVAGAKVSNIAIIAEPIVDTSGDTTDTTTADQVAPLFVPIPLADQA